MKEPKYNYEWTIKDATFTKDKGKVFSCFACGGGSTMGYKLSGFDVLGCNEIDPKMIESYRANHKPKYSFLEPIQDFKQRKDLPEDLYNLDILDGSPPCSSFSMSGLREKAWGKQKKFREGQSLQVLDTLFFDFIDLAERLQPKVVVAENVKGLLMGNAKEYVEKIYKAFDKAGFICQHFLLNSSRMEVPQRRERVFFICLRKDLAKSFTHQKDMFTVSPKLSLNFNCKEIPFKEIEDASDLTIKDNTKISTFWDLVDVGQQFSRAHPKGSFFNDNKTDPDKPITTITADTGHGSWHYSIKRRLNDLEIIRAGTYPLDYNFCRNRPKYLIGMSVPPVMTAQIADKIYDQWLSKIQC